MAKSRLSIITLSLSIIICGACRKAVIAPDACLTEAKPIIKKVPLKPLADWPRGTFCRYPIWDLRFESCADQEGRIWLNRFGECARGLESLPRLQDRALESGEFIIAHGADGYELTSSEHMTWARGSCLSFHTIPVAALSCGAE